MSSFRLVERLYTFWYLFFNLNICYANFSEISAYLIVPNMHMWTEISVNLHYKLAKYVYTLKGSGSTLLSVYLHRKQTYSSEQGQQEQNKYVRGKDWKAARCSEVYRSLSKEINSILKTPMVNNIKVHNKVSVYKSAVLCVVNGTVIAKAR